MSARVSSGRPLGVTVVVVLTAALAVIDLLAGAVALVAALSGATLPGVSAEDSTVVAWVLAGLLVALGVLHAVIAIQLARRRNGARLVLTIMLVVQQVPTRLADADERAATYLSLSVAVVIAFLVWNRTSSLWFDEGRERALAGSLDATDHHHTTVGLGGSRHVG